MKGEHSYSEVLSLPDYESMISDPVLLVYSDLEKLTAFKPLLALLIIFLFGTFVCFFGLFL